MANTLFLTKKGTPQSWVWAVAEYGVDKVPIGTKNSWVWDYPNETGENLSIHGDVYDLLNKPQYSWRWDIEKRKQDFLYWTVDHPIFEGLGGGGGIQFCSNINMKSGNTDVISPKFEKFSKASSQSMLFFNGSGNVINMIDIHNMTSFTEGAYTHAASQAMVRIVNGQFINFYGGLIEENTGNVTDVIDIDDDSSRITFNGTGVYLTNAGKYITIQGTGIAFYNCDLGGCVVYSVSASNLFDHCTGYSDAGGQTYTERDPW